MAESVRESLKLTTRPNREVALVGRLTQIVSQRVNRALFEADAFEKIGVICLLRQPPSHRPKSDHLLSTSQVTRGRL
jgi:hypothetical protein